MSPWPYGMPTSINPFVIFLGISPGNSSPTGAPVDVNHNSYCLPTAGEAHPGLDFEDRAGYWDRVRALGAMIVQAHAPQIVKQSDCDALVGQLNLGTGQFGRASQAPFEKDYCSWVPDVILDHLRPRYVILLGLTGRLKNADGKMFDPHGRLKIPWAKPERSYSFQAGSRNYKFQVWDRPKVDRKSLRVVLWPQHPSRPPMTKDQVWQESGREFVRQATR